MNNLHALLTDYKLNNLKVLKIYLALTTVFYTLNFVFFRHTIDVPADLVFSLAFIIFVPGIVSCITLIQSDIEYGSKIDYVQTIIIHGLIAIIGSMIVSIIYNFLSGETSIYGYFALLHWISIPMVMIGAMIAFEVKLGFEFFGYKLMVLIGFILLYFVFDRIFNTVDYYKIMYWINGVYAFGVPTLILVLWYPKRLFQ